MFIFNNILYYYKFSYSLQEYQKKFIVLENTLQNNLNSQSLNKTGKEYCPIYVPYPSIKDCFILIW
jgi:hypothetical protein